MCQMLNILILGKTNILTFAWRQRSYQEIEHHRIVVVVCSCKKPQSKYDLDMKNLVMGFSSIHWLKRDTCLNYYCYRLIFLFCHCEGSIFNEDNLVISLLCTLLNAGKCFENARHNLWLGIQQCMLPYWLFYNVSH